MFSKWEIGTDQICLVHFTVLSRPLLLLSPLHVNKHGMVVCLDNGIRSHITVAYVYSPLSPCRNMSVKTPPVFGCFAPCGWLPPPLMSYSPRPSLQTTSLSPSPRGRRRGHSALSTRFVPAPQVTGFRWSVGHFLKILIRLNPSAMAY